jgi:S1-C subfamily serine protease
LHEFELKQHKPLGCSVEESLANEPDAAKYVFVADLVKGGNADKIGLRVGDVIVQLSGTFDEVVDVAGLGIGKM